MAAHQQELAGRTAKDSRPALATDALELAESQARHPSSTGLDTLGDETTEAIPECPVPDVPAAVGHLLALAHELLRGVSEEDPHPPSGSASTFRKARLERVRHLRDELHVTANRIARLNADDDGIIEDVRVATPASGVDELVPEHLLFRLELTAARLVALAVPLSDDDWMRTAEVGNHLVRFGEVVADVLDSALQDLHDLLHDGPELPPYRVGVLGRARRRREGPARL